MRRKNRLPWVSFPLSPTTLRCQASLVRLIYNRLQTIIDDWGQVSSIQPREGEGRVIKLCANGHNNSQHCWLNNIMLQRHATGCANGCSMLLTSNNVGCCWLNNVATTCNRVCKQMQHITNIQQCWLLFANNRSTPRYL